MIWIFSSHNMIFLTAAVFSNFLSMTWTYCADPDTNDIWSDALMHRTSRGKCIEENVLSLCTSEICASPCSWFEYGFLLSGYATPIFSELQNMRTHSSPPKIRICKVVQTALNLPISLFNGNNVLVVALWLSLTTHMLKICTLLFCVPMRSTAALVVKQNQGDKGWTYH